MARRLWSLAEGQHGVVARSQLLELGLGSEAITHRIRKGRLHRVRRGVYAVGRPELTRHGRWMAAVLSCGPEAVLSHDSAGVLWGILPAERAGIEVSVPAPRDRRRPGVVVHRRHALRPADVTRKHGIPVTAPACTIVDIAATLTRNQLEAAIGEADKRDLIDPETLRSAVDAVRPRPGVANLRATLDRRTFTLTDSELERRFLPIVRRAGLPPPRTQRYVNGFRVDFYWPELGLVVETDGLRYHRTPAQQSRDRRRDQTHIAAGLTCLRFTHAQVGFQPGDVEATLSAVVRRLR
jgi:very-short-patch-repair endonuclease